MKRVKKNLSLQVAAESNETQKSAARYLTRRTTFKGGKEGRSLHEHLIDMAIVCISLLITVLM